MIKDLKVNKKLFFTTILLASSLLAKNIEFEEMEKIKVEEVMNKEVPTILDTADLEDILHKLTNHNFLCVVDKENIFTGIITRKEILSRVNHLVHEIHHRYDIKDKKYAEINK